MNFLANENFPRTSVRILREKGYNIVSVIEESPGAKDLTILKRAQQEKRIILTFDRDYGELIYRYHFTLSEGVVYFKFDPVSPSESAEILLRILGDNKILLTGKFTVIERERIRQRTI